MANIHRALELIAWHKRQTTTPTRPTHATAIRRTIGGAVRGAHQKLALIVEKNARLPVKLYRHMRALVQISGYHSCMPNREGRLVLALSGRHHKADTGATIGKLI